MGDVIPLLDYLTVRDTRPPSPWLEPPGDEEPPPPALKLRLVDPPDIVA